MRLDLTIFLKEEEEGKTIVMKTFTDISRSKALDTVNKEIKEHEGNISTVHAILS